MKDSPTFDEWFEAKYGVTFDRMYLRRGMDLTSSFVALSREMRAYLDEMMKTIRQQS